MSSLKALYFLLLPRIQALCILRGQSYHWQQGAPAHSSASCDGAALAHGLAALVPVVLRDVHGSAPAGKS